ncbi:MAG: hypothetical protein NC489_40855 [Ruminococcus flavefaciens]|nr:hypothetical protein [Ruminococcus flavefaciens]
MFKKRIAALGAAIALSLSLCMPAFAATSLSEYDNDMYESVKEIIENEVDEDIKDTELEILEAIKSEVTSQGSSLASQTAGSKVINKVTKDKSLWSVQWVAAYLKGCEQYDVPLDNITGAAGSLVDETADANAVSKLHILQWDEDTGGVNKSAMKLMIDRILSNSALKNVMGICMAFSASLCIAFGIGDIMQQATEKSASTEALWRAFLKMCIGLFIIFNCLYIAAFIIYVGDVILSAALGATNTTAGIDTNAYRAHMAMWLSVTSIEKSGGFSLLAKTAGSGNAGVFSTAFDSALSIFGSALKSSVGLAFNLNPGTLLTKLILKIAGSAIISFVISLTVYAVAINIGVRFVFTPLAVADLFSERFRSTGFRWLKTLAAASLQGVIVYAIVIVGTQLREILESGALIPGFSPVTSCIVNLTMIGMFAKSGGMANDIVGSH